MEDILEVGERWVVDAVGIVEVVAKLGMVLVMGVLATVCVVVGEEVWATLEEDVVEGRRDKLVVTTGCE